MYGVIMRIVWKDGVCIDASRDARGFWRRPRRRGRLKTVARPRRGAATSGNDGEDVDSATATARGGGRGGAGRVEGSIRVTHGGDLDIALEKNSLRMATDGTNRGRKALEEMSEEEFYVDLVRSGSSAGVTGKFWRY